jgi:hypothetical protein
VLSISGKYYLNPSFFLFLLKFDVGRLAEVVIIPEFYFEDCLLQISVKTITFLTFYGFPLSVQADTFN